MKKLRRALALLTAAAMITVAAGCQKEITAEDLMTNIPEDNASAEYLDDAFCEKYSAAAFTMLRNQYSSDGENVVISPLASYYNMAMLANGSFSNNKIELENLLNKFYPCDNMNSYMHSFAENLKNSDNAKLYFENALWFNSDKNVVPTDEFLSIAKTYYGASAYKEKFNSETVNNINNWASNKTNMNSELIVRDIPAEAPMCIVNTTCLDADWESPISPENVVDGKFISANSEEQNVRMMSSYEYLYLGGEEYKGFIKKYSGGNYAFLALIPKLERQDALTNLIAYLSNGPAYRTVIKNRKGYTVDASIPKFSCEYRGGLKEMLQQVDLGSSFNPSGANLTQLGTCDGNLYASDIYMSTGLNVTEKGTSRGTAATVRDNTVGTGVIPVALNRPFVFAIIETNRYLPIIVGVVNSVNG